MRKHGWMELGFERTYFIELLIRYGFVVQQWINTATPLGNCFIARPSTEVVELGRCEIDVVEGDAGWYPAEGSHRWTFGRALIPLDLTRAGAVCVSGQNHFNLSKQVTIRCGDKTNSCEVKPGTSFELKIKIGNGVTRLEILTDTHVPQELGINNDTRLLGVAMNKLTYLKDDA